MDLVQVEIHFVHGLLLRVLGHRVEADRMVLQAENLLLRVTAEYPKADRDAMWQNLSPYREVLAGAQIIRDQSEDQEVGHEDTVEV